MYLYDHHSPSWPLEYSRVQSALIVPCGQVWIRASHRDLPEGPRCVQGGALRLRANQIIWKSGVFHVVSDTSQNSKSNYSRVVQKPAKQQHRSGRCKTQQHSEIDCKLPKTLWEKRKREHYRHTLLNRLITTKVLQVSFTCQAIPVTFRWFASPWCVFDYIWLRHGWLTSPCRSFDYMWW